MGLENIDLQSDIANIKVFGVGGGGTNVLIRMAEKEIGNIELVAINTDEVHLARTKNTQITPLLIGRSLTNGRGTGGNVEIGESAATIAEDDIKPLLKGANLIFITAALGGGVGTGATPVIAKMAKEMGILTIGVVTLPFTFEGSKRRKTALAGIEKMQTDMDALLVIHNDNLMKIIDNKISVVNAFSYADDVLFQAIRCIAELILTTGFVNVDFADVRTIFTQSERSEALLGIGNSQKSALDAVKNAVTSPLLDKTLVGARGIILNITASKHLTLFDVSEATRFIEENADREVNIIFGVVNNEDMKDTIQATIIATDFADCSTNKNPQTPTEQPKDSVAKTILKANPKHDGDIELPSFMQRNNPRSTTVKNLRPSTNTFALPAFKITNEK